MLTLRRRASATLRDTNIAAKINSVKGEDTTSWRSAMQMPGANHLGHPTIFSIHESPFDYRNQTRILIIKDIAKEKPEA